MQTDPPAPDYALLDRAGLGRSAFYPRPDRAPAPAGCREHRFEVDPGVELLARLYEHDREWPTLLYFHGNGEVASDHDDIAPAYSEIGLNLLVVEFRGYGGSGGMPGFASLMADARTVAGAAQAWLESEGFRGPRLVMGRSMGALCAQEIAANAPEAFRGLILESGVGGLGRMAQRVAVDGNEAQRLVAAHEAKLRSIRLPVLMLHGERDQLILLSAAAEMYDLLATTERELVVIPDAGHNDILWVGFRQYFGAIRAFVARCLAR